MIVALYMAVAVLIGAVTADFTLNEGDATKTVWRETCEGLGGDYEESNADACPNLIFNVDPLPSPPAE